MTTMKASSLRRAAWGTLFLTSTACALQDGLDHEADVASLNEGAEHLASKEAAAVLPSPVRIEFDDVEWTSAPPSGNCENCLFLDDATTNRVYRVNVEGGALAKAWISPSVSYQGKRTFGSRLSYQPFGCNKDGAPSTPVIVKQRAELNVALGDGSEPHHYHPHLMEESRYYGFSLYIHPQSDPLTTNVNFSQVWQHHDSDAAGKHPPLSLQLMNGTDYRWQVATSNEEGSDPKGNQVTIYTSPTGLAPGVWHQFVYRFKPSVMQNGYVEVWYNGVSVVKQSNQRNFGYTPTTEEPSVSNHFQTRVGAYRGPRKPCLEPMNEVILMYGDVRLGNSYASVAP